MWLWFSYFAGKKRALNAALPGVRERHLAGPEARRQTLHRGTGQGPGRFDAKRP